MTPENNLNPDNSTSQPIGYVIGGGLKANLTVRLTVPADQVQEGGFVVLESGNWQLFVAQQGAQVAELTF